MTTLARIHLLLALLLVMTPLRAAGTDLLQVHRRESSWVLEWRGKIYQCAVGRNGVAKEGEKREGDGRTPSGTFPLRGLYYRPDRIAREALPARLQPIALSPGDGWCDEPADPQYNRPVRLPYAASHEELWRRQDDLYDLILVVGYNDDPVVPGRGSAIFMHVARTGYAPTAGCVALSVKDLMEILASLEPQSRIRIVAE